MCLLKLISPKKKTTSHLTTNPSLSTCLMGHPRDLEGPWRGRLVWNGSKDLQELSISILNVTMNDTGTYNCVVFRQFEFDSYSHSVTKTLVINLVVREEEIMMYVLLVFLTCWLLVEMVYCYRKISKSDEQAQDTAY